MPLRSIRSVMPTSKSWCQARPGAVTLCRDAFVASWPPTGKPPSRCQDEGLASVGGHVAGTPEPPSPRPVAVTSAVALDP